ncbi:hypothetical protein ACSBR2_041595 [Camellia fascicularis]
MITTKKAANAVGGKTARACDSCLRKRARWYCAADDAFLCQACDSSVHSANQLASRHERVRLEKVTSKKASINLAKIDNSAPAWHQAFTKKARTPRHAKPVQKITNLLPLVPEISSEEGSPEENIEQLLYRVPVFDPFDTELCGVDNKVADEQAESVVGGELNGGHYEPCDLDNFHGFLPPDMDLAEFVADVESLLGTGLDEESFGIEGLGLLDCKEEDTMENTCLEGRKVKVENEDGDGEDVVGCQLGMEMARETIDWNFDYESPVTGEEEKIMVVAEMETMNGECREEVERKIFLRLNYEAVISTWASQGCPWTTGSRPELNPNDCLLDFMGFSSNPCVGIGGGRHGRCGDGEREARVTRYREKRRMRLFSKKIRYQVRKLNAEKRPRMKGRFVKRSSSSSSSFAAGGPAFPNYLINK